MLPARQSVKGAVGRRSVGIWGFEGGAAMADAQSNSLRLCLPSAI